MAEGEAGRRRILLEARRLEWAAEQGISVPPLVAVAPDGSWLATERVPDDQPAGPTYVESAVATARTIAGAEPPPASLLEARDSGRPSRWTLPVRVARLAASGIDVRAFARARRQARRLPADELAHGDYHPGNVLFDRRSGRVFVMDMELLGLAPMGTDLLTLWCGLESADDREAVLVAILAGTTRADRERLHHWLALRWLADVTLLPRRGESERRALLQHSLARVDEAHANAAAWTRS